MPFSWRQGELSRTSTAARCSTASPITETAISSRGEPPWDLYNQRTDQLSSQTLTRPQALTLPRHLRRLKAESIEIMRDVVFEFEKPVMLYSIGKDSSVMLHLAIKAFYPAPLPFPLLHVDDLEIPRDDCVS